MTQKRIIKLIMHTTIFCSVLIIIESTAKFSFKYLFPSAENVQENVSHKFENSVTWLDNYWKEYYQAVQLRFPQQRLPLHKTFEGKYINIDKNGWRKVVSEQNQITQNQIQQNPVNKVPQNSIIENKIFLFGNSTLWGVGSPDSLTIPSLFAQKINQLATNKTQIEVQNFAVCSWNSTQMLVQLQIELQKGNIPRTVIFLNGATDMSRTLVEGGLSEVQNYEILSQKTASKIGIDSNFMATNIEYLLQRINTYKILRKLQNLSPYRLAENSINSQNNLQNVAKAVAKNYFKNYMLIDSLSKQYKFNYVVCWQPFSLKRAEEMHPEDAFFRNFATAVNQEIVQQSQLNLYPNFYNLADSLKALQAKKGNLFLDYCHLTTFGNQYIVDILLQYYKI